MKEEGELGREDRIKTTKRVQKWEEREELPCSTADTFSVCIFSHVST